MHLQQVVCVGTPAEPINSNDKQADDELQTMAKCYILPHVLARRGQQGLYQKPPVAGSKTTTLPAVVCRATCIRRVKTQGLESKGIGFCWVDLSDSDSKTLYKSLYMGSKPVRL